MEITMRVPNHPLALNGALEGLVRVSAAELLALLMRGHDVPDLYSSGIRYEQEPPGQEFWGTVAENFKKLQAARKRGGKPRHIDCEDLAGHLAGQHRVAPAVDMGVQNALTRFGAESIIAGCLYPARAVCRRSGKRVYHAVVEHPDGTIEDPSRALGMRPRKRP
jgi:hypothetical protein